MTKVGLEASIVNHQLILQVDKGAKSRISSEGPGHSLPVACSDSSPANQAVVQLLLGRLCSSLLLNFLLHQDGCMMHALFHNPQVGKSRTRQQMDNFSHTLCNKTRK